MLSVFETAEKSPHATALVSSGHTLSYAELAERTERAAASLHSAGLLRPGGAPVALVAHPTLPSLLVLHALIAHGVPLLLVHAALPSAERLKLMERARASALVVPDEAPLAPTFGAAPRPPSAIDAEATLAVVPTSGSSGRPKLVVLSRRAAMASAHASAINLPLRADDRWLLCLPLAHVGGLSIVTRSLLAGCAIAAFDSGALGLLRSLPLVSERLRADAVTVASFVPTLLAGLLELEPEWWPAPSLRAVLLGGAAMPLPLLERARQRAVPVLTTYGLTEACSQVTTTPYGSLPAVRAGRVSAGRALPGVDLRFDAEQRVRVRGSFLCSGYLDEAGPLDSEGWLTTEDRGELDRDGNLFLLGRSSDRIVSGGENVDPRRVEAVFEALAGVRVACVVGLDDARFGEIVGCVIVADPADPSTRSLESLLNEAESQLARHERPRKLLQLAALPLLPNGKLDGVRIRELLAQAEWVRPR